MKSNHRRSGLMAGALFLCLVSGPAAAEGLFETASDTVSSIWDAIRSPFSGEGSTVSAITTSSPVTLLRGVESGSAFWQHIEDAGYELMEVSSTIGLIPDVEFDFQLARELSDADRDSLERKLEIDEMRNKGLVAALQRQIVRTLLDASDLEDMRIVELKISVLPLPGAEFVMEPIEAPLSEEHDQIFRAIQKGERGLRRQMKGKPKKNSAE